MCLWWEFPQGPGTSCSNTICTSLVHGQPLRATRHHPSRTVSGLGRPSHYNGQFWINADVFHCEGYRPITDIHWWGSYSGWGDERHPHCAGSLPHRGLTHVPAGVTNRSAIRANCSGSRLSTGGAERTPSRCDFHPDGMQGPDTCFLYDFLIPHGYWLSQPVTHRLLD